MVWIILAAFALLFLIPSLTALVIVYFVAIIEPPKPTPLTRERTHRGVETCQGCNADCFADDWVCLCECHEGRVPLHRIKERKTILAALGRPSGVKLK